MDGSNDPTSDAPTPQPQPRPRPDAGAHAGAADDAAPGPRPPADAPEARARYAVYWTPPPDGPLSILGEQLFGPGRPALAEAIGVEADTLVEATQGPAHYGLHATLRAPFHLAEGVGADDLHAGLAALAGREAPVTLPEPELAELGPYLVLQPSREPEAVNALAGRIVEAIEPYRAALSAREAERRRGEGLSPRQEEHLRRWGYPYVFDSFRFHITLAGPCDGQTRTLLARALQPQLAPLLTSDWTLEAVSLCTQPDRGSPFEVAERFPLGG
jgi:hypothetical protein